MENRFMVLFKSHPEIAKKLLEQSKKRTAERIKLYQQLANLDVSIDNH